jgi:hypothetical protein
MKVRLMDKVITWALCFYALLLIINNWWNKWIDFVEIKFHSYENMEWNCMQFEFNSIQIWLDLNLMKVGCIHKVINDKMEV